MTIEALRQYFASLGPDTLDARSATIGQERCRQLVDLLATTQVLAANFVQAQFSADADFSKAQFTGDANFLGAQFTGGANFIKAQFRGDATFIGAQFTADADFLGAQFTRGSLFGEAQFTRGATFYGAHFTDLANFHGAEFTGDADFYGTQFSGGAMFSRAQFSGDARFGGAQFSDLCLLGPLRSRSLDLNNALFEGVVTIQGACSTISASNLRARESFTLAGRGCDITMIGARFDKPSWIATSADAVSFPPPAAQDDNKPPRLLRVEARTYITLVGLDLSACRFFGAYNLDQLHIDGPPNFAETPSRWRWARRRTLAEEHIWRATYDRRPDGWYSPRCRTRDDDALPAHDRRSSKTASAGAEAARVQAAYRELRKSFEDARNEPGAADFYYSEMEMRRMVSRAAPPQRVENA